MNVLVTPHEKADRSEPSGHGQRMPTAPESPRSAFPPSVPDYHLIRVIGEGSFGQVWLARGATGTFRAVKIVRRELADGGRAFARAFRGLRHYEPISRQDESLMHVLHVGPSEPDYHFYAVIELADPVPPDESTSDPAESPSDAKSSSNSSVAEDEFWKAAPDSRVIDPDSYEPLTLASLLERQRRCRVALCVETGIALCRALGVLHRNGLVHRDVKPSNIIFSQGRPKLADIDLVTPSDSTLPRQFAQGFSPPEGAGSPSADLYSLGKVLYEMSTGNDRTDFPNPPLDLHPDDEPLWADLNEVVIRACAKEPAERYQSAQEMHDDLQVVRAGGSVRRLRALERRQRILARLGVILICGVGLATLGFLREQAHRKSVQELAESNRRNAMRLHLSQGFHLINDDDTFGALPSFAAARELDAQDLRAVAIHDVRLQTILAQSPALICLGSHEGEITGSEFSQDGTKLVTGSVDRTARVWDSETGEALTEPLIHTSEVLLAKFSGDHRHVFTLSIDGVLRVWDLADGRSVREIPLPVETVEVASLSPDRHWIAVGGHSGELLVRSLTSEVLHTRSPHHGAVKALAWSPDGRRLASAGDDGEVWMTDITEGLQVLGPLRHAGTIRSLAFDHETRLLASGSSETTIQIWEVDTGRALTPLLSHEGSVWSLRFSSDSKFLFAGGGQFRKSGDLTVWSVSEGRPTGQRVRHRMPVNRIEISPDGTLLATASVDQSARIWDLKTLQPVSPLLRFNQSVRDIQFSPDGRRLLASSRDGTWRIWRIRAALDAGHELKYASTVSDARVTPEGHWIISGTTAGEARIDDRATFRSAVKLATIGANWTIAMSLDGTWLALAQTRGTQLYHRSDPLAAFDPAGSLDSWRALALSHHGKEMIGWCPDRGLEFMRLASVLHDGNALPTADSSKRPSPAVLVRRSLDCDPRLNVLSQEFSPDGKWIAVGFGPLNEDPKQVRIGEARLYHSETGVLHAGPLLQNGRAVALAFSPNSKLLLTACSDATAEARRAHLWDVASGTEVGNGFPHADGVACVGFSRNGRWVATGGEDAEAQIWDVATQSPIGHRMKHSRGVLWVEFSPDNRFVVTGCADGTARLWDGANGDPISAPIPSGESIRSVRFTPDGNQILTASSDGWLRLRTLPLRSVDGTNWEAIASLNAGIRTTPDGESVPLSAKELSNLFHQVQQSKKSVTTTP